MLENWLSKVNPEITSRIPNLSPDSIGQVIKVHKSIFPDIEDCQIVLCSDNHEHMDQIRLQFYEMYHHLDNLYLADLGDLRNNDVNFIISLFTELLESKLLPVLITSDPKIINTFHFALNAFEKSFESLYCGKRTSFYSQNDFGLCKRVTSLGAQGHLNPLSKLNQSDIVRLAQVTSQIEEAEPYTRITDTICFDLNIMQHSDIPGHKDASPNGLNAQEFTQLFRFFGFNERLKCLFIYNYNSEYDFNRQTAQLIAQGLWYFTEARNQCILDNLDHSEEFNEFLVDIDGLTEPLVFLKAKKSGRWWIKEAGAAEMIPCTHKDYLVACQNEIPEKLARLSF